VKLTAPYPPGVNTLYGVRAVLVKGRPMAFPYKTREHSDYAVAMKLASLEAGLRAEDLPLHPKPATVALRVDLYRPRRAGDIDGPLKTLLDVLQGIAFENDDQVARLEVYRHDDKGNPRVELDVTALTAEQPELPLTRPPPAVGRPLHEAGERPDAHGAANPAARVGAVATEPLEQRLRRLARPGTVSNR
jgi:Holliday junction resolvase RusA-like endonuclease